MLGQITRIEQPEPLIPMEGHQNLIPSRGSTWVRFERSYESRDPRLRSTQRVTLNSGAKRNALILKSIAAPRRGPCVC